MLKNRISPPFRRAFYREQDFQVSEKFNQIEWQANYFASCLLMPRHHVLEAIRQFYRSKGIQRYTYSLLDAVPELAKQFGVSHQAMKYRLEEFSHHEEELMFLKTL